MSTTTFEERSAEPVPQADCSQRLRAETTRAIQDAMVTAAILMGATLRRPLCAADTDILARAGQSGWDCAIFRIVGDAACDAPLRVQALHEWIEGRDAVVARTRTMARALIGDR